MNQRKNPRGKYKSRKNTKELSLNQYKAGLSFYKLQFWNCEKRKGKTDDEVKLMIRNIGKNY